MHADMHMDTDMHTDMYMHMHAHVRTHHAGLFVDKPTELMIGYAELGAEGFTAGKHVSFHGYSDEVCACVCVLVCLHACARACVCASARSQVWGYTRVEVKYRAPLGGSVEFSAQT
jgi:hypothetical protein